MVTTRRWQAPLLVGMILVATLATVMFGIRTYRSFLLLRSARELGANDVGTVRPWMTLRYVATTYRMPEQAMLDRLGLPTGVDPSTSLRTLARQKGHTPFEYVRVVQTAIVELRRSASLSTDAERTATWLTGLSDELITAVLRYGYPVLALILMAGAAGLPLPSGLSMVVAGSLAAQGHLTWWGAGIVAVVSSVLGDMTGYALGRLAGREFLDRRGRWVGLTPARVSRVEALFSRWGGLSVVLSRSLLSFLSSAVNLLAGASRYRMRVFLPFDVAGRLAWTSAYLGLGYGFGEATEAAADFLSSLGGLLVSVAILAALGFMVYRRRVRLRVAVEAS